LLPSLGVMFVIPPLLRWLDERRRALALVLPAVLLVIDGAGTVVEGTAWADEVQLWGKAVALEPGSAQAHRNLGTILLQRGQAAEALRQFDEARALGENAGELDRRRAMALEALGRFDEAETAVTMALARSPELGTAHALRGGLLARRGAVAEAERELAAAARLEPTHPSTLLLEIEIAAARGDTTRELVAEMRLIERHPAEPRFYYRRALTRQRSGDAAGAAADARACLGLAPEQPQCRCLLDRSCEK
jgi:tetratricopeptide (TPR) repeat protein